MKKSWVQSVSLKSPTSSGRRYRCNWPPPANRQRTTCQVTLTGKKNALIDLREIITADGHNIRTADGNIVFAAHEP